MPWSAAWRWRFTGWRGRRRTSTCCCPPRRSISLWAPRALGFAQEAHPIRFHDGLLLRRITRVVGTDHLTLDRLVVNDDLSEAWVSRQTHETDWGPLVVLSRDGLIGMKVAAGRPQDLADIDRLRELDR